MSAAASGFELTYRVINPTERDLKNLKVGTRLYQKADIPFHPNRAFEEWCISKIVDDLVTVKPLNTRWVHGTRVISKSKLYTEYRLKDFVS